jgi:hypothetical protein
VTGLRPSSTGEQHDLEAEPRREVLDLRVDGVAHLSRERLVLVDGVDTEHALVALGGGVQLADQPVAVQDRQRVVAPDPLGLRLVHLQHVVEAEQLVEALAVHHQPVERRQQRGATLEVAEPLEVRRLHPPRPLHALDHGRLAGVADVRRLGAVRGTLRARDAQGQQPAAVPLRERLVGVGQRLVVVHPLGQVPQLLPAERVRDRDLVALEHVPEHLLDVLVVRPAARAPRALAGVGQGGRRQRALRTQRGQDVLAALLVGREPAGHFVHPGLEVSAAGPVRRLGPVQRQVLDRSVEPEVVHQPLVLDQRLQLAGVVRRPQP